MRTMLFSFGLMFAWALCPLASVRGDDSSQHSNWPRFRGPLGTGHSTETNLPVKWDASSITGRLALPGVGQSSPVVWGDHLFLTAAIDGGYRRAVIDVDRNRGVILWQKTYETGDPGKTHSMNQHGSSTCVTDGTYVYSFFGQGGFYCHDFNGAIAWSRDDLGEFLSIWGTAASPILYEDKVIVCCDQDAVLDKDQPPGVPSKAFLIAMNKRTGEPVWKTPRFPSRGWGTPVPLAVPGGGTELVLNGPGGVVAYDPGTGAALWSCDREVLFGTPSVAFHHDLIFALSGRPGPIYAIKAGGRGNVTRTHLVWSRPRRGRDMPSPIVANNLLFAVDMRSGTATCYEPENGEEVWKARIGRSFTASPVAADGHLYFLERDGTTVVIKPERKPTIVARNRLPVDEGEDFLASPAVSDGQIFLRSDRALYTIGKRR